MKKKAPRIFTTTNYDLFKYVGQNREVDLKPKRRKDLRRSMERYGYIPAYPLYCTRENGRLLIRDGQHRLAVAKKLGLPVCYVICKVRADIAEINNTQVVWKTRDYARAFASAGLVDYQELLDFAEAHKLSLSVCVGILGNTFAATSGKHLALFREGKFKVTSRDLADRVAGLYSQISGRNRSIRTRFFVSALFAACLVEGLDDRRFISGAKRYPEALQKYGSRDGYLQMLEKIYNYGRGKKEPVKIAAENVLAARNPVKVNHAR